MNRSKLCGVLALQLLALALQAVPAGAQATVPARDTSAIEALVDLALQVNPGIRAAMHRLEAARARVSPAGALPDPIISAGIQNLPLAQEAAAGHNVSDPRPDMMTMKMIAVGQTIPYPGKLRAERAAARLEVESAEAALEAERLRVSAEVRGAYYGVARIDRALEILDQHRQVLAGFVELTAARYRVGTGTQQDVLRAGVEASRLAESATVLREQRVAVLARLNALLDRASDTPLPAVSMPAQLVRAALSDAAARPRFVSEVIGARLGSSPVPPLAQLQQLALAHNAQLRAHGAMVAAQRERVALARKAHLPDFDLMLEYGQRDQRPDMISARVSVPIPIFRAGKQSQQVREAEAMLAALEAQHAQTANDLRERVARLHSDAERARTELALLQDAILPQARASLEAASAAYRVGTLDLLTLLENQATLFNYETEYHRLLSDFASAVAQLERATGRAVLS